MHSAGLTGFLESPVGQGALYFCQALIFNILFMLNVFFLARAFIGQFVSNKRMFRCFINTGMAANVNIKQTGELEKLKG